MFPLRMRARELEPGVEDGAGGDAAEDPFALHQQAGAAEGGTAADKHLAIEEGEVEDRRDEAVGEALEALELVAGVWLDSDHLCPRIRLFQPLASPHERATGAETRDEEVHLRHVLEDLGPRPDVVGAHVVGITELVEHEPALVLGHLPRYRHGASDAG